MKFKTFQACMHNIMHINSVFPYDFFGIVPTVVMCAQN